MHVAVVYDIEDGEVIMTTTSISLTKLENYIEKYIEEFPSLHAYIFPTTELPTILFPTDSKFKIIVNK